MTDTSALDQPFPIKPEGWPRPRGYSNGFRVPAGRDLVFVAGMIGWDENERIVPGGFCGQFEQALRNIVAVVEEAGGTPRDLVQFTAFVVDREEYLAAVPDLGEVWRRVMGKHFPTMALVQVAGLVESAARVEIQAVAAVPPRSAG